MICFYYVKLYNIKRDLIPAGKPDRGIYGSE